MDQTPPTHALLPLAVRDLLIRELEWLPMRDVKMVVDTLRQAPVGTVNQKAPAQPPAPDPPPVCP